MNELLEAADIYARARGYIAKRNVDIGSRVKGGDLLALMTAPEFDHPIAQAEASPAEAKATHRPVILTPPVDLEDGSKIRIRPTGVAR